jgi:hypothetical protein
MSNRQDYLNKMAPFAQMAAASTGLPVGVVLAQWVHETGWGGSVQAKQHNNHAGIKGNSSGRDYTTPVIVYATYAGYNSTIRFVEDYSRLLTTLTYYKDVIRVARSGGSPYEVIKALNASPWAVDPLYGAKLKAIYDGYTKVYDSGGQYTPVTGDGGIKGPGWDSIGHTPDPAPPEGAMGIIDYDGVLHLVDTFKGVGRWWNEARAWYAESEGPLMQYGGVLIVVAAIVLVGKVFQVDIKSDGGVPNSES